MKKILYFVLLIAELFVGSVLMISLWDSSLYIPLAVSVGAVVGLLIWQLVRYIKITDAAVKKKIFRNIALIMLIPIAVFFITYVVVAIAFIIAFV
jgi:hypothetical protein